MNAAKRQAIFSRFRSANPDPRSELKYQTPFELLVSVILSAQATDKSVNLATRPLFRCYNTAKKILALEEEGLIEYIKSIGLFRSKARHIIETCRLLLEHHDGEVPADRESLEKLPGVGRKTANVILNVAFGEPTMAVDTHIFRLSNRIGIAPGKTPLAVEMKLLKHIPEEFMHGAHHWLILHGRYVCKARKPECGKCSILDLCDYKSKNMEGQ